MKTIYVLMTVFTIASTLTAIRAHAADTDCKNIVQTADPKAVTCDPSKGACPAAAPAPKTDGQTKVN